MRVGAGLQITSKGKKNAKNAYFSRLSLLWGDLYTENYNWAHI
jgi:hypothetical protein